MKKIEFLRIDRRNYVLDYLHKASRRVIAIALDKQVGTNVNRYINGILDILRKNRQDKCIPELVKQASDNGVVNPPGE